MVLNKLTFEELYSVPLSHLNSTQVVLNRITSIQGVGRTSISIAGYRYGIDIMPYYVLCPVCCIVAIIR